MSIKNKLRWGISFLFLMALLSSGLAAYYLNKLSYESNAILKDNYRSLVYTKNIGRILDSTQPFNAAQLRVIDTNLMAERHNITEPGERDMADSLKGNFELLKGAMANPELAKTIKLKMKPPLYSITEMNMIAIERKNNTAKNTANHATIIVALIGSFCFLIAFSFVINFPGYIANPVKELIAGIKEISGKNYQKRLVFNSKDEFGELADAFNQMARKLNDYENSNLASIMFEKKRIEAIINSMQDAVVGFDDKMIIVFANHVACTLIGKPEDQLTGAYGPDIALENDLLRNMLVTDQSKMKIYADNKESYFSKESVDVINDGLLIGKVVILKNITEFQQLDEAKTNFIATISHELKTPISSIKMSLKLLDDARIGDVNDEQKQLLQNIDDDTRRLLQITGELLDMAQVETGKINLNFGSTHPKNIVNYAAQAIKFIADQKQIAINITCPDSLPEVQADLDKTTWVLINLLSNAVKYSPTKSTIELVVKKYHNDMLEFSVKDYGQGIDARYLLRIFERYFKVPGAGLDKTGTGLGLAIAKDFIEAQGGKIGVESRQGEGSRFFYTLKIS
jgi:signal transduction histidine kinase